ncbi:MAG: hypothetical protein A2Z34_05715 [Planctomycetes bacterium RBG_16_59_8]|nr:MAG: hypothetical protein A2Z34_05715 [Planctomycetes bacterium RBG_16_59_8]
MEKNVVVDKPPAQVYSDLQRELKKEIPANVFSLIAWNEKERTGKAAAFGARVSFVVEDKQPCTVRASLEIGPPASAMIRESDVAARIETVLARLG